MSLLGLWFSNHHIFSCLSFIKFITPICCNFCQSLCKVGPNKDIAFLMNISSCRVDKNFTVCKNSIRFLFLYVCIWIVPHSLILKYVILLTLQSISQICIWIKFLTSINQLTWFSEGWNFYYLAKTKLKLVLLYLESIKFWNLLDLFYLPQQEPKFTVYAIKLRVIVSVTF